MKSLRAKMTLLVLLLGAPFLFGALQGLVFSTEQGQLQEKKSLVRRSINRLAKQLRGSNPRGRIEAEFARAGIADLGAKVTLIDRDGTALWRSDDSAPLSAGAKGVQSLFLDQGALIYYMPEREQNLGLRQAAYLVGALALTAYGVGAWLLVGRTLQPISQLVREVEGASRLPEALIAAPTTDAEIANLAATINALLSEVRRESQERIDSYAMLSHELRTPIQALYLSLDDTLSQPRTQEELEEALVGAQRQVYRLNALSEAVLFLQGLKAPGAAQMEEVRVRDLVEELLAPLLPIAEVQELIIENSVDPDLRVLAHMEHLGILLRNLLENALKYSDLSGTVRIWSDGHGAISIQNHVPSTPICHGTRIGLTICRAVAKLHGWGLAAEEQDGSYLAVLSVRVCT